MTPKPQRSNEDYIIPKKSFHKIKAYLWEVVVTVFQLSCHARPMLHRYRHGTR